jgi:hypothetical protein
VIAGNLVIGEVTVETPEPCLPYRARQGLIFPIDTFRTTLPTPELEHALAKGYIKRVHSVALYSGADLFTGFVRYFFDLRLAYKEQNNQAYSFLCKLMLNSLSGKFGQGGRVYQDIGQADSSEVRSWQEWDADDHRLVGVRQFGGITQEWHKEGESFNSHPAIAAHVTSYARMWLWKLIKQAGDHNVYYCDTDSLVVNKAGFDNLYPLYGGEGLGELKLEKSFDHLVNYGAKDYIFGDKVKVKGIKAKARQVGENVFVQDRFSKFKTMLKNNDLDRMIVTPERKVLKREYTKGIVTASGWVKPFTLSLPQS